VEGRCMGGGCIYPSCWVAAVHYLRKKGTTKRRLAYIDIDAHRPDGIWKEVERLQSTRSNQIAACDGVLFASIHVDGYPNPGNGEWTSAKCLLPKGPRKAFEVRVNEELLKGVNEGGTAQNSEVLAAYGRWKDELLQDLEKFSPNALFIGLGFDLHKAEERIMDKREGIGLIARDYREILHGLAVVGDTSGPVVLTLEGGYTRRAIIDGMSGALAGLVALSRARRLRAAEAESRRRVISARSKGKAAGPRSPIKAARPPSPARHKAIASWTVARRLSLLSRSSAHRTCGSAERLKGRARDGTARKEPAKKRPRVTPGG